MLTTSQLTAGTRLKTTLEIGLWDESKYANRTRFQWPGETSPKEPGGFPPLTQPDELVGGKYLPVGTIVTVQAILYNSPAYQCVRASADLPDSSGTTGFLYTTHNGVDQVKLYVPPPQPQQPQPTEPQQPQPPEPPTSQPGDVQIEVHAAQTVVIEVKVSTTMTTNLPGDLGQDRPRDTHYQEDPLCPIANVFYDEVAAYFLSNGEDNDTSQNKHAIGIIFKPGVAVQATAWAVTASDEYGAIEFLGQPQAAQPSPQDGITFPAWLRVFFARRYTTNAGAGRSSYPYEGLADKRLNYLDRIDKLSTNVNHQADRKVPPCMNIVITRLSDNRQWVAVVDVRTQHENGAATSVPMLRPAATALCAQTGGRLPPGYTDSAVPKGIVPTRDECHSVAIAQDGSLALTLQTPMHWNQLTVAERALGVGSDSNELKYRSIGYNSVVSARYNSGFRMPSYNQVALEVAELSPITNEDTLSVEVSFDDGRPPQQLDLMGRVVKGTECAEWRSLFLILWRFRGSPRTFDVAQRAGFRVRVRDQTLHLPSLTDSERINGRLPIFSGHPFWRVAGAEDSPGIDLTDIVVFSNPLARARFLFVLDHSGSMTTGQPVSHIENVRAALSAALAALAAGVSAGSVPIQVRVGIFKHTVQGNTIRTVTDFNEWLSPDQRSQIVDWVNQQTAEGETPLMQAINGIPNALSPRSRDVLDYVVLLSDGMHALYTEETGPDPADPSKTIRKKVDDKEAGALAIRNLVSSGNLPDKLFIFGVELSGANKEAIEKMGAEAPVYLDRRLSRYLNEAGVMDPPLTIFLSKTASLAGTRDYLSLREVTALLTDIPDTTIPATTKATIKRATERSAREIIDLIWVNNSSELPSLFSNIVFPFVSGSRGCLACDAPRLEPRGISGYLPAR